MMQKNSKISWKELESELSALSNQVNFQPDIIVGIVRGGVIPARLLSSLLNVQEMFCLTVEKHGHERQVVTTINKDLKDKKILLVEDILETGKSLLTAKKYLEEQGASVKTACLYLMPETPIKPDFYLRKIEELVGFPWE